LKDTTFLLEEMMPAKTQKTPLLVEGSYSVEKVNELNFFDLSGENANTKGTSNKMYHAELHIAKQGPKAQIFTMWGATGTVQRKEWRYYNSINDAKKDYEKILKGKRKKGYKDIDVAQRVIGSEDAKKITKPVKLKNMDKVATSSKLHSETSRLISSLIGSTNNFVKATLKCPLGQLSNDQIESGRKCLDDARSIIGDGIQITPAKEKKLLDITNQFYALIPHNLGSGSRGKLVNLLLDSKSKIDVKEYDLDTLLDAKAMGINLNDSSVDTQYASINTDLEYIDHSDSSFKWLNHFIRHTRASNHRHLGDVILLNAWEVNRHGEDAVFTKTAKKIAEACGGQVVPEKLYNIVQKRPDGNTSLHKKANIIPLFHGTRTQNVSGIFKRGILIRPSGVVITGAMYGNGAYYAQHSTKSINYTSIKSSYWAKGGEDKGYLFIADCILGNQKIAQGSHQYSAKNIAPDHSVWAKSGKSGVLNDEFMIYDVKQQQLRYILEFTCK